jgi:hypothetical protein
MHPCGCAVLELIIGGRPVVPSNLKTFLETGEPVPAETLRQR